MDAFPPQEDTYPQYDPKPHPRKRNSSNMGLYSLLIVAIICFVTFKLYKGLLRPDMQKLTTDSINAMNFNGRVTGFTFDGTKDNTKIAILSDGYKLAIYKQWVYDIDLGDSLVKEKNSLQINVYKPKKEKTVLDYYPILRRMELKKW